MLRYDPIQATDFYKVGHKAMYPEGTEQIYSNMTPRSNKRAPIHPLTNAPVDYVVNVGLQLAIQSFFIDAFNENFFNRDIEEVIEKYNRRNNNALYPGAVDSTHIRQLHALGYLPLVIKALPEGSKVPFGVPVFTVYNTLPEFYWLTNYVETVLSALTWHCMTVATIASIYYDVLVHYAEKTGSPVDFVAWQGHDFSARGIGLEDQVRAQIGHLIPFMGTDTVLALGAIEDYYGAGNEYLGGSVPATEHSVMCAGGQSDELGTFKRLIEQFPSGVLSIVSDTWDYWKVLNEYAPALKNEIEARKPNHIGLAKVVFRPDSGDPENILCGDPDAEMYSPAWYGSLEILWKHFGGTINEKGYRVLNQRVGLIYGDSITLDRANKILKRMEEMNFASCNIVFGIGSYTYQYITRDTLGFAVKATAKFDRDEGLVPLFKDPVTDDGTKKSARGLLQVYKENSRFKLKQNVSIAEECEGELLTVFEDGKLVKKYNWSDVRENWRNSNV